MAEENRQKWFSFGGVHNCSTEIKSLGIQRRLKSHRNCVCIYHSMSCRLIWKSVGRTSHSFEIADCHSPTISTNFIGISRPYRIDFWQSWEEWERETHSMTLKKLEYRANSAMSIYGSLFMDYGPLEKRIEFKRRNGVSSFHPFILYFWSGAPNSTYFVYTNQTDIERIQTHKTNEKKIKCICFSTPF